ncbi:MAG: hypothetical protein AAF826_01750 [Pseudomonadota bacterium]
MADCAWWVRGTKTRTSITDKRLQFVASEIGQTKGINFDLIHSAVDAYREPEQYPDDLIIKSIVREKKLSKSKTSQVNGKSLPQFFQSMGLYFICNDAVEIFETTDLGEAILSPVECFEYGGEERISEPAAFLVAKNVKDSFIHHASHELIDRMPNPGLKKKPLLSYQDDESSVVLGASALSGPEVWKEKNLKGSFFISDLLAQKLFDSGLADDFDLVRARIVDQSMEPSA